MRPRVNAFHGGVSRLVCECIFLTFVIGRVQAAHGADIEFGYNNSYPDGPKNWGQLSPEWSLCHEGRRQSPIHIRTKGAKVNLDLKDLNTSYIPSSGFLVNDGHALAVEVENAGHFWLDGEDYTLLHFHFHSPSEHVIDGVQPPLEMHMVHESADGKRLAVIGIPFKEGPRSPFLDEFWSKLPQVREKGAMVDIGQLVVDNPRLHVGPNYVRYMGSLTTPPCTEGVKWTVALDLWNTLSRDQIQAFRQVLPEPSDRPTQKLHGRDVYLRTVTVKT